MKIFKKATAILCATVIVGSVCAACACGDSGNPHKPSAPAGVQKVSEDNMLQVAQSYEDNLMNSRNYTLDVYSFDEENSEDLFNSYTTERQRKTELTANLKLYVEDGRTFGDCILEKSDKNYETNSLYPDFDKDVKYNYSSETVLRDDTVYSKYTDGQVTQEGKTEPVAGLNSFFKTDGFSLGEFDALTSREGVRPTLTYFVKEYLYFNRDDTELYLPGGDTDQVSMPKSSVKSFEVDFRVSETKLYFSYKILIEENNDNSYSKNSYYKKSEYVYAADISAGLKASDFKEKEIAENDIENVLYINPDKSVVAAKLNAGEPVEILPLGGGNIKKLKVTLTFGQSEFGGTTVDAQIADGKIILNALDAETLENDLYFTITANYNDWMCMSTIVFNPD